jgi:hypothetical protein
LVECSDASSGRLDLSNGCAVDCDVALGLLTDHPALSRRYDDTAVYFCLLDDLKARGPFAHIFWKLGEQDRVVNWLGKPKEGQQ